MARLSITTTKIVHETTNVIWDVLMPEYLPCPATEHEWKDVSQKFESKWQFNHYVGVIDGKLCRAKSCCWCFNSAANRWFLMIEKSSSALYWSVS